MGPMRCGSNTGACATRVDRSDERRVRPAEPAADWTRRTRSATRGNAFWRETAASPFDPGLEFDRFAFTPM